MKQRLLIILLLLSIALPTLAQESTEVPTDLPPTSEVITATPVDTATPEATIEPTATPVPEPEPPTPPSTDWSLLIPWIGAAILVGAIGLFVVLRTALVQLGKSVPLPAWEIGKGTTKTLYEQLMQFFSRTPNTVDDYLGGEAGKMLEDYFKEVDQLRAEVKTLKAQVAVNSSDIAYSARQAQRPPTTPE